MKILIDSGSNKNLLSKAFIRDTDELKPIFISSILGSSKQTGCTKRLNILHKDLPTQRYFVTKVTKSFDALIGSEYLAECNAVLDYENMTLRLGNRTFQLKKHLIEKKMHLNILRVKTNADGNWVLAKPYKISEDISIQPGLYKSSKGESTVMVSSDRNQSDMGALSIEIQVNNFCTIDPLPLNPEKLSEEDLDKLIRTNHLSGYEKEAVIKTLLSKQGIFLKKGEKLSASKCFKHKINTTDNDPIYTKSYRYPEAYKKDVHEQIKEMLDNGIIKHSKSPYSAPIWVVPKKMDASGKRKVRVVIDYRKLNDKTKTERFPIPKIEEILDHLGNSVYFTTLDLKSGFHQILMHPEDREKTAFSTDLGHYEFVRMPFGLKNAPMTFQKAMNLVLDGLVGYKCLVYLDDIIVLGASLEEHLQNLQEVFDRLIAYNLKIQLDKCEFLKRETEFLGHVITPEGVKPDPEKVKAILEWPTPKTCKEIKQFIGFCSYYRRFIKNFALIAKPLTKCLKKDTPVDPNHPSYVAACQKLKDIITSDQVLAYPVFTRPFIVTTDASDYAIGAVLSQVQDGLERPIAFASRTLNETELRWDTTEKEALAIVWATQKFKPYVYGTQFTLVTDHKPLTFIKTSTKKPKVLRWRLEMEDLQYEVIYKDGKSNVVADGLSRKPEAVAINVTETDDTARSADDSDHYFIPFSDKPINNFSNQIIFRLSRLGNIAYEEVFPGYHRTIVMENDYTPERILAILKRYFNGKKTAILAPTEIINTIQEVYRDHFSTGAKFVLTTTMVEDVTSMERQDEIIMREHERAHRGISENEQQIRRAYFFPGMHRRIQRAIAICKICNENKYERKPYNIKISPRPITERPFERVHMDIFQMDGQNFLSLIDSFSKYLQLIPMQTKNLVDVKNAYSKFISTLRPPRLLITDHENTFRSIGFQEYVRSFNTTIEYASSSESNGQIERAHSTVIELFNTNKHKFPNTNTKTIVRSCVALYNDTIHSSTSFTPNEIIFNVSDELPSSEQRDKIYRELKEYSKFKQEQITKMNEKKEDPPEVEEGQKVYIIPNIRAKKSPRAVEQEARDVQEKTFKIEGGVKRNKSKIKRIKKPP